MEVLAFIHTAMMQRAPSMSFTTERNGFASHRTVALPVTLRSIEFRLGKRASGCRLLYQSPQQIPLLDAIFLTLDVWQPEVWVGIHSIKSISYSGDQALSIFAAIRVSGSLRSHMRCSIAYCIQWEKPACPKSLPKQ